MLFTAYFIDVGVDPSLGFMGAYTGSRARAVVECETAALKLTMSFAFNRRSAIAANQKSAEEP